MARSTTILLALVVAVGCDSSSKSSDKSKHAANRKAPVRKAVAKKAGPAALDVAAIGKAAGTKAKQAAGGAVRIGWLRTDVPTTVDQAKFPPTAGLGSWAGFMPVKGGAMVMGDTVVYEDEINPAIDAAFAHGLQITALHNHFAFDNPAVYFMHIGGRGEATKLAAGVKAMWDAIKTVRKASAKPARGFPGPVVKAGKLDAAPLEAALKQKGGEKPGGVIKFVFERRARMAGRDFGGNMGLATWAAFSGDNKLAAVDGDVAMTAGEVQAVLHALRAAKLNIVALHNHMIGETPAYFFVHYWGKGPAAELAKGFRGVLDAQTKAK